MDGKTGQMARGRTGKVDEKEQDAWSRRIKEGEKQRAVFLEYLGDPSREERVKEIEAMEIENMKRERERKLSEPGRKPKDDITTEEQLVENEETARKIDGNLKRKS
jgi:hypothetical protein